MLCVEKDKSLFSPAVSGSQLRADVIISLLCHSHTSAAVWLAELVLHNSERVKRKKRKKEDKNRYEHLKKKSICLMKIGYCLGFFFQFFYIVMTRNPFF